MADGIAAELVVARPGGCPVASASDETGAPITSVSRAAAPDDAGRIAEEFALAADEAPTHPDVEAVGAFESHEVYRFSRAPDRGCVCDAVEQVTGPVSDIEARDGSLYVSFIAPDLAAIREVVTALRERFGGVRLRQLVRADDGSESDPVVVDRNRLTDRQREVLRTAHERGYFEHPKGANAGEVADAIGIAPSTFREHLAAAQRKLLDAILEATPE